MRKSNKTKAELPIVFYQKKSSEHVKVFATKFIKVQFKHAISCFVKQKIKLFFHYIYKGVNKIIKMGGYYLLAGLLTLIGMFVSGRLKSKFAKYSQINIRNGKSGFEIAKQMLHHFGISDVQIVQGKGFLTDHYNPLTKTVALSPKVYEGRSIMSAAVAAHECGHAVQHATAYDWLQMRSAIVPIVNIASNMQQYLLFGALMIAGAGSAFGNTILMVTILAFAITTAFAFITLPVEFDASKRALNWLEESGETTGAEFDGAKDALWWAAMTYVSSALSSLVMLIYLILRLMASRN